MYSHPVDLDPLPQPIDTPLSPRSPRSGTFRPLVPPRSSFSRFLRRRHSMRVRPEVLASGGLVVPRYRGRPAEGQVLRARSDRGHAPLSDAVVDIDAVGDAKPSCMSSGLILWSGGEGVDSLCGCLRRCLVFICRVRVGSCG